MKTIFKRQFGPALLIFLLTSASTFAFPLHHLIADIQKAVQTGRQPVAVFDLDETILHSAKRKVMSYQDAMKSNILRFTSKYPSETHTFLNRSSGEQLRMMMELKNQYDSKAWFARMGIQNESFRTELDKTMLPIYLSAKYMNLDSAYHGAKGMLDAFYRAGAVVYFVSSRYRIQQYDATLQRLLLSQLFRNSDQSKVILREDDETSIDFKTRAFSTIQKATQNRGSVIAVGENEPENLNVMMRLFPQATAIFIEGAIMNTNVELGTSLKLVKTKTYLASDLDLR